MCAATGPEGGGGVGGMALTTPDRRRPLSILVSPVRTGPLVDHLGGRSAVVCVTDLDAETILPATQLRLLFGLTEAESRVVLALVDGSTPREASERLGLSFFTVRAHLMHIYQKTQTRGQADLARLLTRVASGVRPQT